ncbi:cardioacceleratory peptide receptor-like [Mytilus trossulus]|uniref:cardioacceleratory peptide receptor-like n=1 Tax=Mytilus trossulus TaxID=6551 RepID=UPI0030073557
MLNMNLSTIIPEEFGHTTVSSDNGTNGTGHADHNGGHPLMEEQLAFLIFLLVVTTIGNSIVLVAVSLAKNRSRMTFFIMHLAIADLLVGLVSLMPDLIWRLAGQFYGGEVLCKIVKFSQCLVTYGSTFVLVALSIDRLDAIARPLGFSTSKARNRVLVTTAWLIAAVFSIPAAVLFKTDQCMINLPTIDDWKIYVTIIAFAVFIIPAIIIAFCYGIMVYIIVSKNSALMATMKKKHERKPLYYRPELKNQRKKVSSVQHDSRASSRGIIPQAKIRTIKMTFVIILVFIMCWSPYFLWNLLQVYGHIKSNHTNMLITVFVQSLAPLNSAINPVIYGVFSTRICRQLRRFKAVKVICDIFPFCADQTRMPSDHSTMVTDNTFTFRRQIISPSRSIYNQGESFQMETCDLIASVLPDKKQPAIIRN